MPPCWGAKNKTQPGILFMIFYMTGQHFTNGLNMFCHHSVSGYTVTFFITIVANNSNLTATTANTVIGNNSKLAKPWHPIHSCQRIDILADIERDYVT